MIPSYDVDVEISSAGPNMTNVGAELRTHCWTINADYFKVRPGDWEIAERTIAEEATIIGDADRLSSTPKQFEDYVYEAEENVDGEGEWFGYDAGVAGLTLVLNAAGFATATSCRKHADRPYGEYPHVVAACDQTRFDLLIPLVRQSECGLSDFDEGGFGLYAKSVPPLMRLAALVLDHRAEFHGLPETIPWEVDPDDPDGEFD